MTAFMEMLHRVAKPKPKIRPSSENDTLWVSYQPELPWSDDRVRTESLNRVRRLNNLITEAKEVIL